VRTDLKSGAHFIPAPAEEELRLLLHTGQFAAVIEEARRAFDIVILDTPPVMTSADAAVVGKFADACLFLVRWGRISWDEVTSAVGYLRLCGISPDGIVMVAADGLFPQYGAIGDYAGYGAPPTNDRYVPPPFGSAVEGRQARGAEVIEKS
jgi:polysaccharide biosynthesis transport protein